ncbi:Crp/Fnr family transcriptional regulator [Massilia yuzhufengensis]|uniref:cAMP-binding domain of CRP or a regulatory subunit of cAMP-dependent protein kinases n=1 Tax=Massilia yuzhufengensis TaxID=1164594 RepID=A0A1I1VRB5_9BURK|nr:Crp/Fnr family transcriptional regulator [Massilia yuzhufengensis]SFD85415.1 cAMP-binding domain of CRP or a regulatory subunit of cAMP-dependent protein kinases [Massilia yuzhufengensis]
MTATAKSATARRTPAENDAAAVPEERQVQIHLRKIPLLAELSDEEIIRVKQDLRIRQYSKRDIVLQKGGHGDGLMFLLSGQLQVIDVTEDGRAIGLRMLASGDFFGEIALINDSTRSASVVAMSDALVAFLPAATAMHLFSHSPSVAKHMLKHLAEKIQRDSEFRSLLSINNTAKRIYTYLVLMQKNKQVEPGAQAVVENLPTHQDIANMINTSRETVTRALTALAQQGIVQKDAHRLIIVKPDALQKLVQGS